MFTRLLNLDASGLQKVPSKVVVTCYYIQAIYLSASVI